MWKYVTDARRFQVLRTPGAKCKLGSFGHYECKRVKIPRNKYCYCHRITISAATRIDELKWWCIAVTLRVVSGIYVCGALV